MPHGDKQLRTAGSPTSNKTTKIASKAKKGSGFSSYGPQKPLGTATMKRR
jgi:hypothetical protein